MKNTTLFCVPYAKVIFFPFEDYLAWNSKFAHNSKSDLDFNMGTVMKFLIQFDHELKTYSTTDYTNYNCCTESTLDIQKGICGENTFTWTLHSTVIISNHCLHDFKAFDCALNNMFDPFMREISEIRTIESSRNGICSRAQSVSWEIWIFKYI